MRLNVTNISSLKWLLGFPFIMWKLPLNQTWNWHWLTNRTTCMSSKTHIDKPDWSELQESLQLLVFWKWDMMAAVSHANKSQENVHRESIVDTLKPRQNGHHFADDSFNWIFFNENASISIKIPLKCFPDGPINHIPASVHIMAWRRSGDKQWLGAVQATSHYLNQWWLDYWRIFVSLGLNELRTTLWLFKTICHW